MEFTADQQNTANQLQNSVGSVFPDISNTDFWSQYFNPTPTLTADEQSTGISIGPADSNYYTNALRSIVGRPVPNPNRDLVDSAYAGIGRTGIGTEPNQIDQEGYDYWLDQLNSGALNANSFRTAFENSVNNVLSENPNAPTSRYVSGYMEGLGDRDQPFYSGPYQSSLIKSLRDRTPSAPTAPGVMLRANKENYPGLDFEFDGSGQLYSPGIKTTMPVTERKTAANKPPVLNQTDVENYLPYVIEDVNTYLGDQSAQNLVKQAYENIGREGIGTSPNQIDQQGYDYWVNEIESGNLDPVEFNQAFNNSVSTVLNQQPDAPVAQYVDAYLSNQSPDQLVRDAYADIGRTGIGATPSTIDQEGYDYWTGQIESGALTPEQFQVAFWDSVNTVLGGYGGAPVSGGQKPAPAPTPIDDSWGTP